MDLDQDGLATRRAVLGADYVDNARCKVAGFTNP